MSVPVGIDLMGAYCGVARIDVEELFAGRGLDPARIPNIDMRSRSVALPFEDPVTHAVHAAAPLLARMTPEEVARIETLVVSTESGVDHSKSVTSYVHRHLDLPRSCRILEVKQACYGATGAIQLLLGYLASGISPGAKALVVATDVAVVDERAEYSEPAAGTGAMALLLSADPRTLTVDLGAFGSNSFETFDSARPLPTADVADSDRSLLAYLECLGECTAEYRARVENADVLSSFGQFAFHTPFAGLVRAAHRQLLRDAGVRSKEPTQEDFERRVAPSLVLPRLVGNMCSGSVYLAFLSSLLHARPDRPQRVGLFSYGSGCSSEFFSGVVDAHSTAAAEEVGLPAQLAARRELAFAEYLRLNAASRQVLVPQPKRVIDVDGFLDLLPASDPVGRRLLYTGIDNYHRQYAWA